MYLLLFDLKSAAKQAARAILILFCNLKKLLQKVENNSVAVRGGVARKNRACNRATVGSFWRNKLYEKWLRVTAP